LLDALAGARAMRRARRIERRRSSMIKNLIALSVRNRWLVVLLTALTVPRLASGR